MYNNSTELRTKLYNKIYILTHKSDNSGPPESVKMNYADLADVYRVPMQGSGKEIEEFNDLNKYTAEVFDEENYNPPTGIYTHSSEIEDDGFDQVDIYDNEVAK
jgi:hypothetical protein